jgi:DNA-binding NtrC family response regulator
MKYTDLDLRELLTFDPSGGLIRFAGQRALIFDAVALGLLRRELIETVGWTVARGVLTRFGFAHGWRTAQTLREVFPWDDESQWRRAGGRLHTLQGQVLVDLVDEAAQEPEPFAHAIWRHSYEAEQHVLHLGLADEPVCWTLCGFASGYTSYCRDEQIYFLETRCVGCGDDHCEIVGQPREDWGPELEAHIHFFQQSALEASLNRVTEALKKAERKLHLRRQELAEQRAEEGDVEGFISRSPAMRRALELVRRVAGVEATVLVTGEPGTGKSRIARLIHTRSRRADRPILSVTCGALSESLLEAELFGRATGHGQEAGRVGLFESADNGTLVLEEVGELPASIQTKLLATLNDQRIRRLGGTRDRPVDVRVIATSQRDLAEAVASGRFRQDLYYRLRVVEIVVPPVRSRREDLLELARCLLAAAARRLGRSHITGFSPVVAEQLLRHHWPGNVRELENVIEHAGVLCRGRQIEIEDLPENLRSSLPAALAAGSVRPLAEIERDYILAALEANDGHRETTAQQLGIGVATLYRKLRTYRQDGGAAQV